MPAVEPDNPVPDDPPTVLPDDAVPAVEPNDLMPGDPVPAVQPDDPNDLTQCQAVIPQLTSEPTVVPGDSVGPPPRLGA
ncbi:unnamed protein product [Staurois parvus]|uniref:Uncharacterized protein n=1 Tax=Staurois parvus TaxID=386267 RepID=A0ABN9C7T8_9NEOB|nr:unnamed protein product [Staurois parvus]